MEDVLIAEEEDCIHKEESMPYKMKKVDGYQVKGPSGVHAKNTTKGKAEAQMRLLRGVEHGMVPKKMMKKSIKGSPPMTNPEMVKGYRSLGRGLPVMDGKAHATENRGEGY